MFVQPLNACETGSLLNSQQKPTEIRLQEICHAIVTFRSYLLNIILSDVISLRKDPTIHSRGDLQGELIMVNPRSLIILTTLCSLLWLSNSFAEDYTRWGLPEGAIARFGKGSIRKLVYFPNGTRLAVRSSIGIWIYDAHTGEAVDLLAGDAWDVNALAFSPDGKTLAITKDKSIRLLDPQTRDQKAVLAEHIQGIYSLAFSPTGEILASGSSDTAIRLWDVHTR